MSMPSFLNFLKEKDQLDEAFNSAPYDLTFGKKNAGDIFFTFIDEDDKEYRIQFYTPQGLGKNVRQVFIGQKRGSTYPDAITAFKNPMRVIASMIEATKQFMATALGKTIDGYAINFSQKALQRGVTLVPKIIRQSGLKQKLNVMDLTYSPVPDRAFVWCVRKGKDPAVVFDGPKMKGVTWDDPDKIGDVPDQAKRDAALQGDIDDLSQSINAQDTGWKLTNAGGGKPVQPMMIWTSRKGNRVTTANIAPHAQEAGYYVGSIMNEKHVKAQSPDTITRNLLLPPIPIKLLNQFTQQSAQFWQEQKKAASNNVDNGFLPTTGSVEDLVKQGYVAKILGIVDTYAPQMVGMYSGEKLTRTGQGKYKTAGGMTIQVYFWGIVNGKLSVEVVGDLSKETLMLEGNTKDAAMQIVKAISMAVYAQFAGEVEVRSVPINDAPYAIQRISRSQDYSYVDCGSFVLKIADALINRFQVGKALSLDLMREFPRTTFIVKYDWYSKTNLVVSSSDGKTIFGDINTDANPKDAIIVANLTKPTGGSFFGESVNGFSVMWNIQFPNGGNLDKANLVTNVTFDRDNQKANINIMLVKDGHVVNNAKSWQVPLKLQNVQRALNDIGDNISNAARQISTLNSDSYNPKKAFLNDVSVDSYGEIMFQGKSLKQSANAQAIITALAKMPEEKSATALATYAGSVRDAAPKGRDLDWDTYASRDGQTVNLDWSITFRRNTSVGAYKQYQDQIKRANQYLQSVYQDAKSKGYNPTEPNLFTLERAQRNDDMTEQNEGSAYSEYEQAIGGNMQIRLK